MASVFLSHDSCERRGLGRFIGAILITAAIALISASGARGAAIERVTNGGFEAGDAPWTFSGAQNCQGNACVYAAASGSHYAMLGSMSGSTALPSTTANVGEVSQLISVPAGPATVSLRVRRTDFQTPGAGWDTILRISYNGSIVEEIANGDIATGSFVTVSAAITTSFSSSATLELKALCVNMSPSAVTQCSRFDVDDVSVVTGSAPSAPTLSGTDPSSPSSSTNPRVRGVVGSGDPTVVKVFTNGNCSGPAAANRYSSRLRRTGHRGSGGRGHGDDNQRQRRQPRG